MKQRLKKKKVVSVGGNVYGFVFLCLWWNERLIENKAGITKYTEIKQNMSLMGQIHIVSICC